MFERLLYIREDNFLKQKDLAEIIGVDRSIISKWETNKEIIPLEHLNTYSNYFNISLDYLAGISQKKTIENTNIELDAKIIGERLKKFRKEHNLTLQNLADLLNTSPSTISAYESGKVLILTSFAYSIAVKYNISLDWLCGKKKDLENKF